MRAMMMTICVLYFVCVFAEPGGISIPNSCEHATYMRISVGHFLNVDIESPNQAAGAHLGCSRFCLCVKVVIHSKEEWGGARANGEYYSNNELLSK